LSGTQQPSVLASYRDAVTERLRAGAPFGDIEDSIDAVEDLTMDEKAALWLFAFRCATLRATTRGAYPPGSAPVVAGSPGPLEFDTNGFPVSPPGAGVMLARD